MTAALQTAGNAQQRDASRAGNRRRARSVSLKGFDQTSIKDITDIVGGSRRDIYGMFTDKEGLFDAVLQSLIAQILSPAEMTFPRVPVLTSGRT